MQQMGSTNQLWLWQQQAGWWSTTEQPIWVSPAASLCYRLLSAKQKQLYSDHGEINCQCFGMAMRLIDLFGVRALTSSLPERATQRPRSDNNEFVLQSCIRCRVWCQLICVWSTVCGPGTGHPVAIPLLAPQSAKGMKYQVKRQAVASTKNLQPLQEI